MTTRGRPGVIGKTGAGQPIITSTNHCEHFERQSDALTDVWECWYCKHAGFREKGAGPGDYSVCRFSGYGSSAKLCDDEPDAVVGGFIDTAKKSEYLCSNCGAVFYQSLPECPDCHKTGIPKVK
jgi:hypothetical protein